LISGNGNGKPFILSSADGVRWRSLPVTGAIADANVTEPISANASTVVAFNSDARSGQPLAVYLRNGTWRPSAVAPGHLPDAGVVPNNQRTVNAVCNWETGFIAIGNVNSGVQFSGMVWYSTNGAQWLRQPVLSNGFEKVDQFMDAAASKGKVLLVAAPADGSDLLMWQSTAA
jgi:hypothetical protein